MEIKIEQVDLERMVRDYLIHMGVEPDGKKIEFSFKGTRKNRKGVKGSPSVLVNVIEKENTYTDPMFRGAASNTPPQVQEEEAEVSEEETKVNSLMRERVRDIDNSINAAIQDALIKPVSEEEELNDDDLPIADDLKNVMQEEQDRGKEEVEEEIKDNPFFQTQEPVAVTDQGTANPSNIFGTLV